MKKTSRLAGITLLPAAGGFALGFRYGPKIVGALLVLAAWAAAAQPDGPPPGPGDGPRHHPHPLILRALDTNGDGIIDANEIANAPAALKALDKNGDGQLTLDEFIGPWAKGTNEPPNGRRPGHHPPPPLPLVKALDVNSNGIIDADEIANASAELLKLDKNGDGQLTPDEFLPPRPEFGGGPPRGGDGQRDFNGPPPGDGPPDFDGPPPGDGPPDGNGPPDGPPPGDPPPDGNNAPPQPQ
ncbi:MAG TPA: EF-hand domain-containing protein [Verrucomicrobiae bacterium]|jgi:hypothetical protein